MNSLGVRLLDAKLAGRKIEGDLGHRYEFRSNASAAGAALHVVAAWLADEAAEMLKVAVLNEDPASRADQTRAAGLVNDLARSLIP